MALILPMVPAAAQAPEQVIPNSQAAAQCAPVDAALEILKQQYGERIVWWGATTDDDTMIVTERPDTKTWTLLVVHKGEACMVAAGGTERAEGA